LKRREDRKQSEALFAALENIESQLQAYQDKFHDEETLKYIGEEFLKNFEGNIQRLESDLLEFEKHIPEITDSLNQLKDDHKGLEDGQQEIIKILSQLSTQFPHPTARPSWIRWQKYSE
jgi:hypothetical protein